MAPLVIVHALEVHRPVQGGDGEVTVLAGVDLLVEAGEVLGIVGETGSGRSTLVRSLNGIVPQLDRARVEGRIEVAGLDPTTVAVADMAQVVAIVLDDPEAQVTQPTVLDEVAFGPENLGVAVDEIRVRVHDALERVGLAGFERRNPLTLSGGEQQRLAVAAAIAMRPRLLVLDEPTANLDPRSARQILGLSRDLASRDGVAVIVVSDDADLLAEYADRIAWLDGGRIRAIGTPSDVFGAIARETDGLLAPAVTDLVLRLADASARDDMAMPVTVEEAKAAIVARIGPVHGTAT